MLKMKLLCVLVSLVGLVKSKSSSDLKLGARDKVVIPYHDSFTIQDSCQFNLCGPEYGQEFLPGGCQCHWSVVM